MNIDKRICILRKLIKRQLVKRITSDYIYIDLPYYQNIGDLLIWEGTEHFLSELPHKCLYKASYDTYESQLLSHDTIIIMQGGGNFGDLWRVHQEFRLNIIENYPDNRIIILPQTVFYESNKLLKSDAEIMTRHKRLTICARDEKSYRILKRHHMASEILIMPDMAFCIPDETVAKFKRSKEDNVSLLVKRNDKECDNTYDYEILMSRHKPYDESDWPSYEYPEDTGLRDFWNVKATKDNEQLNDYAKQVYLPYMLNCGSAFVTAYKSVYTTRLHVAVLCMLLHKPVVMLNNSYGKNYSFYKTWLMGTDGVEMANYQAGWWQQLKSFLWIKAKEIGL